MLDLGKIALVDVENRLGGAGQSEQLRVRGVEKLVQLGAELGQKDQIDLTHPCRPNSGDLLGSTVRCPWTKREGPLDGAAYPSFGNDGEDFGVEKRTHVSVERGRSDVRQRFTQLYGGAFAISQLVQDTQSHRVRHDVDDTRLRHAIIMPLAIILNIDNIRGMTMAQMLQNPPRLRITFSGWERYMALRSTVTVPSETVTAAHSEAGWTSEILGWRKFGLVVSGVVKVGTFTHPNGTRRLVAMRRNMPLLRVSLEHPEFDEILLSTPDASSLASALDPVGRQSSQA